MGWGDARGQKDQISAVPPIEWFDGLYPRTYDEGVNNPDNDSISGTVTVQPKER